MPRSKTGAGPGLNGAFFTSKKPPRPGQNLVLKIDWIGAGPGLHGAFFCLKEIRNNPIPGQNLVLNIDWTGANFSTKQPKTGANLNAQNRLDRPTADQ